MRKFPIFLVLFSLTAASTALADILHLKSGDSLEGEVIREDADGVTFSIQGGAIDFERQEIDHIERGGSSAPAPASSLDTPFAGDEKEPFSITKTLSSWFPKKGEKKTAGSRAPPRKTSSLPFWALLLIHLIVPVLVTAVVMKFYFAMQGEHFSYFEMIKFQIKLLLISAVGGAVIGFVIGLGIGITSGGQPGPLFLQVVYMGVAVITYYWLAKRDLDAGFITAFFLSIFIGITNFAVSYGLETAGLSLGASLLEFMQQNPSLFPGA